MVTNRKCLFLWDMWELEKFLFFIFQGQRGTSIFFLQQVWKWLENKKPCRCQEVKGSGIKGLLFEYTSEEVSWVAQLNHSVEPPYCGLSLKVLSSQSKREDIYSSQPSQLGWDSLCATNAGDLYGSRWYCKWAR